MISYPKIIRQEIKTLDPDVKKIIELADTATSDKFHVVKPRLWWTIILASYSLILSFMLLYLAIIPPLLHRLENIKDIWFIFPLVGLFIVIVDIVAWQRVKNQYAIYKSANQFYLYLAPEGIIERAGNIITIIPKNTLLYAYEEYANYGFHIAYKGEGLSTLRYQLMNDHSIHYNYNDIIGIPSPMRTRIMNTYNLTLPPDLNDIDNERYPT